MQISFTGGFLANGGILQISRLKVNSKHDLYYSFAPPMKNRGFFPQKPLLQCQRKRLRQQIADKKLLKGKKQAEKKII
ncbi:hypothetical protein [Superficieibacter sp. 1612_C1]|uniref:hypothetical protein n=1 Tax=Superficieibacter sp. 1612_C1 TaxID=2780382 RepID=UPI001883870F|nr:hypothetical protein [Superficieibacter sp. 1612_C1]